MLYIIYKVREVCVFARGKCAFYKKSKTTLRRYDAFVMLLKYATLLFTKINTKFRDKNLVSSDFCYTFAMSKVR